MKEASLMLVTGGAVGLMERAVMGGEQVEKCVGYQGGGGEVGVGCGVAIRSR